MTRAQRAEFLAGCREKARQCRDTPSRIKHPDQRTEMEGTAQMWDRLAQEEGGGPIDELLAAPAPPMRSLDTDESRARCRGCNFPMRDADLGPGDVVHRDYCPPG
jgi:hypothetical protein